MITLKNLNEATPMGVFNQARGHLLKQGKRSINYHGDCAYLSPDGSRCGAGVFIGPDEYEDWMSYHSWITLSEMHPKFNLKKHRDLIFRIQQIHDNIRPSKWGRALLKLKGKILEGQYNQQ